MLEEVRKYMEAALEKLTPTKAQEVARSVMQGQGREQVAKVAQDLLEWSQKNRDRLAELIQREVRSQLKTLGVATQKEMDALKKRIRELERGANGHAATKRSSASKKGAAKRSTARKPSSSKATA